MESWRKVWRLAAPLLPLAGLLALRDALRDDDMKLIQGATTSPPPLQCVQDWDVDAACVIGYCGWHGSDLKTVGEVEEFFARLCYEIDGRLGEPAGCRWLLNWFDDTPRQEMRRLLLAEVALSISRASVCESQTQGGIHGPQELPVPQTDLPALSPPR